MTRLNPDETIDQLQQEIIELQTQVKELREQKDDRDTAKAWFNKAANKINDHDKRLKVLEKIADEEYKKQLLAEFPTRKRTYALAFIGFCYLVLQFSNNPIIITLGLMIFIFFLVHDYFIDDAKSLIYAFVQAWRSAKK